MGLNAPSHETTNEQDPFSRETFAGGLLVKKSSPVWLDQDDKYRLFLEVEKFLATQPNADAAFAKLGLTRAAYYERIWFTESQAEEYAKSRTEQETPPSPESDSDAFPERTYRPPTAEEKLRRIEEVSRLRYVGNMDFDEACRRVGITKQRFYDWSSQRLKLMAIVKRKEQRERTKMDGPAEPRAKGKRGRKSADEIDPDTLAHRAEIVEAMHREVTEGTPLRVALRKRNVSRNQYAEWARQTEHDILPTENLLDVWKATQSGENTEAAKQRLVRHLTPLAKRMAHRYAIRKQQALGFVVDEEELVSHALFEGVYLHIDKYDPSRGGISAYFSSEISHKILDCLRQQDWVPRLERTAQGNRAALIEAFTTAMGRPPWNDDELLEYAGPDFASTVAHRNAMMKSLDMEHAHAGGKVSNDNDGWSLHEVLPSDERSQDREMRRVADLAEDLLTKTHGMGRRIMELYHLQENTMKEIGARVGFSESRVSQIHTETVERLRAIARSDENMPQVRATEQE